MECERLWMNVPMARQKRLVIVGATGMVGGYTLGYALDHPSVALVTAIVRRKLAISHPKLNEVLHKDFAQDAAAFLPGRLYRGGDGCRASHGNRGLHG